MNSGLESQASDHVDQAESSCLDKGTCDGGGDQGVVDAMPSPHEDATPRDCRPPSPCFFLTKKKRILGPFSLPGDDIEFSQSEFRNQSTFHTLSYC